MCGENLTFYYYTLLLILLFLIFQSSSVSDDNEDNNSTEQYKFEEDIKKNCGKKAELMRYNSYENYINSNKNNSNKGSDNKNYIVPHEMYDTIICIQLCCSLGDRLVNENCITSENKYVFPNIYSYSNNSIQSENKKVDELFPLIVQNPCQETIRFFLYPDYYFKYYKYMFFANSSLYLPYFDIFVESTSYCLAVVDHNQFDAIICLEAVNETINKKKDNMNDLTNEISNELRFLFLSCRIVSVLCLLIIFVVYSIFPELRNIHSFMLRKYCSLLFFGYVIDTISFQSFYPINIVEFSYFICVIIALVSYFCFLSSFFWLSAMSFDIWWTFRDFRLLQKNVKQERKKLIYSIFAWGGPFIFTIFCIIMDFVPNVPKNLIRPEFCVDSCWFYDAASQLFFYGPKSVCVISSICLSIYTALKIVRYEKNTVRHLRDSQSRFYNDNKRWFSLYLRLFIMLFIIIAIDWIISTAYEFWLFDDITMLYILRSIFVMDTMQDIGMFIIFVCKKTIIRLLLKHFWQNCKSFSKTST
ncbi:probable G-protein coupled receptor Mth-like 3 isoform X2 [Camponotus floridanus]|uniref:probable G-protein coupled receptor Mth-like 3 isoform X2 n=1 Tax=Camponotus floridanus TaxID=104421 RepID=UPI000DC6A15B|nr:probable G-protein coupled receptor Mth-like 3 isoform X2 [Camponotus floridanus]